MSCEVAGETVVYDSRTHQAHSLSPMVSLIWQSCTGRHTVEEIAARVRRELGTRTTPAMVDEALNELGRVHLIEGEEEGVRPANARRREVLRKLAIAGGAAVITTVIAPVPAAAASCTPKFGACGAGQPPCCAGLHCNGSNFCA